MAAHPSPWVRTCPYCGSTPTPFGAQGALIITAGPHGQLRWQPAACPACGRVVIFQVDVNTGAPLDMIPKVVGEWEVEHLPPSVASIWREAQAVYRVNAYRSAVVACGRTLEQAAEERDVSGRTLQQRITKMQEDGLITAEFKNAMDYVRLIRNVGAHAGHDVTPESAQGTMRFTQQTLRLLFEVPAELQRLAGHPPELDVGVDDEA